MSEFLKYLKQGFEIIKLNRKEIKKAAKDENAIKYGIIFLIISSIANYIGTSLTKGFSIEQLVIGIVGFVIYFPLVWVLSLIVRLFNGEGTYKELLRPSILTAILGWILIIPFAKIKYLELIVLILYTLWGLIITIVILEEVFELTKGKSILALIVYILILSAILIFIAIIGTIIAVSLGYQLQPYTS